MVLSKPCDSFDDNRFLHIKKILPPPILDYLRSYCKILRENNKFFKDGQCPSSLSIAGDPGLDAILEWVRPKLSRIVGLELTPVFSYMRVYAKGEVLKRHTDRPPLEFVLTVSISIPKGAGPSTIFLQPPGSASKKVEMLEGDGCLIDGEVEHWRDAIHHDGYIQIFLFFFNARGRYPQSLAYDGRRCLGEPYVSDAVLTVDGERLSMQSALAHLNGALHCQADLKENLVNRLLIDTAAKASPQGRVGKREIERAVDEFRVSQGLYSGDATQRWLDQAGLTMSRLRELIMLRIQTRKLREGIVAQRTRPYFDAHREDFDVLTVFRVETPSRAAAWALAASAQGSGLWASLNSDGSRLARLNGTRETRYQRDLPGFADAAVNAIIGPERSNGGYQVGELLRRRTARFDRATRIRIEGLLFDEWLAERRRKAAIEWHWDLGGERGASRDAGRNLMM